MMNIDMACEAFRKILEEQQERIANMVSEKTDFTTKKTVTIHYTDGHHFFGGEIGVGSIHVCNTVLLFLQQLLKGLAGLLDIHYWPPSLV